MIELELDLVNCCHILYLFVHLHAGIVPISFFQVREVSAAELLFITFHVWIFILISSMGFLPIDVTWSFSSPRA